MNSTEILVIAIGLVLGYWIVSKLIGGGSARNETARRDAGDLVDVPHIDPSMPLEWHKVLDVDRTASVAQIRAAYQEQLAQYQPDKVAHLGTDLQTLARQRTRAIESAYHQALHERGYE